MSTVSKSSVKVENYNSDELVYNKESFEVWNTAIKRKYGDEYYLTPAYLFNTDETSENQTRFDLARKNSPASIWSYIIINKKGQAQGPDNFYQLDNSLPDELWDITPLQDLIKPLTKSDLTHIINALEDVSDINI